MLNEENEAENRLPRVAGVAKQATHSSDVALWVWIPYPRDEHVYLAQLGPGTGMLREPARETETVRGILHVSIDEDIQQEKIEAEFSKGNERFTWKNI